MIALGLGFALAATIATAQNADSGSTKKQPKSDVGHKGGKKHKKGTGANTGNKPPKQ